MNKKIMCPECDGHGVTIQYATDGLGNKLKMIDMKCTKCNGTGEIEVPMTNFDYIKSLNIEDMAEYFGVDRRPHFPSSPCYVCEYEDGLMCVKPDECTDEYKKEVYKKWLGQEYQGE